MRRALPCTIQPLMMPTPLRIAHRGMPRLATENTLPSFALALECGADGIELDVHATRDDIIVVHHNSALHSGTQIRETALADLLKEMPDLPTLVAVCELVNGRAELFVEIKGSAIEQLVEAALTTYAGHTAIHSFDHAMIARLAGRGTKMRLGVLVEEESEDALAIMRRTGAHDVWPHHPLVSADLVAEVHAAGGRVIPWTVNATADIARMQVLQVDGICTDDVREIDTP